ncbi:MAG: MlaD family protein, partial [Phycisphaeraceae bacterium]|nr:MlaD family protein [Phycisphaeraceae bacterium]
MTESARNTIVGLTAIVGMVGLAWLIFIFGDAPKWVVPSYTVHVKLDDASGLANGSPIRLDGIQVGEIDQIRHRPEGGTLVVCRIETEYDIPANVDVFSESSPLGGSATLKFVTQPPNAEPLAKSGEPAELTGRAASFTSQLGVMVERFSSLSEKIEQLATEYTKVGQSVRSMVEQRSIEDVEAGRTEPNISTVISRADRRVAELSAT